jgi:nucleotide-binding universal stress UspA family protein
VKDAPILICYDGSGRAAAAVGAAAELFPGRRAVVVDVSPLVVAAGMPPEVAAEIDRSEADDAALVAEAGAELARRAGLVADARSELDTSTWQGVADVADAIDAAAIVIGSHGLTGLRELLHPSRSDELAARAQARARRATLRLTPASRYSRIAENRNAGRAPAVKRSRRPGSNPACMGTHLMLGFGFGVGMDERRQLTPSPLPVRRNVPLCASCGSPDHQLCARMSVGETLILRLRRPR